MVECPFCSYRAVLSVLCAAFHVTMIRTRKKEAEEQERTVEPVER
jgi:hypothetical protein